MDKTFLINQQEIIITYDSIQKISIGQVDDYATDCLLEHNYFKKYKIIAIDLSKRQALDADPKAIQQINFTGNLDCSSRCNNIFHH